MFFCFIVILLALDYSECVIAFTTQESRQKTETNVNSGILPNIPKIRNGSSIQCVNLIPTLNELKQKIEDLTELSRAQHQENDIQRRQSVLEGKIDVILQDRNQMLRYYEVLAELKLRVEKLEEENSVLKTTVQNMEEDNRRTQEVNSNTTQNIESIMTVSNLNNQGIQKVKEEIYALNSSQDEIEVTLVNINHMVESHDGRLNLIREMPKTYGNVYVRWGKKSCGGENINNGTELIYAGQVAGSDYQDSGAAVNYLCLPNDPVWGEYDIGSNPNAFVYGASIDVWKIDVPGTPWEHGRYNKKGVYCAVCQTRGRTTVLMIPGRNECYPGWTEEYHGYLSSGYRGHTAASEYQCLDVQPDEHPISKHVWHKMFHSVEARCDGPLSCPPYVDGKELTCVVCSK